MNAAPVAAANSRSRKIERSSIGARAAPLDQDEGGSSTTAATRRPDHHRVVPAGDAAASRCRARGRSARRRRSRPSRSSPRSVSRLDELAQDEPAPERRQRGQRHVEPEDPVPGDRNERPAEHRPDHQADGGDHRVGAHRQAELLAGKCVGDQRRRRWRTGRRRRCPGRSARGSARCRRRRSRRRATRAGRPGSRRRRPACGRTGRRGGPAVSTRTVEAIM